MSRMCSVAAESTQSSATRYFNSPMNGTHNSQPRHLTAIEALASGLTDGGVRIATNFPGFHSHELFALCGGTQASVNERTAFAIAWGAAFAGARSAVMLKNVGLNDAFDPFLNSHLAGINAGLVVVVFDDVEVEGSQCRLDSRHAFDVFGGLWLEPGSVPQAYALAREAFELSERFQVPVVIRVTNALLRMRGDVHRMPTAPRHAGIVRAPERFVIHPVNHAGQEANLRRKNRRISAWVEGRCAAHMQATDHTQAPDQKNGKTLRLNVGAAGHVERAVDLFTYPLPERLLRRLLLGVREAKVREVGDGFVREKIRALACGIPVHRVAPRTNDATAYRIEDRFENLFCALRSIPSRLICGDIGSFTMDAPKSLDACLCLGSSVAVATGAALAAPRFSILAVAGDAGFSHSGKTALEEAAARGVRLTVVVIDNGGSQATGGQVIPGAITPLEGTLVHRLSGDNASTSEISAALRKLRSHRTGPSLLHYVTRP